jgi:nucleotide-binding universal stress UspA family protein/pimeloyl-ACP methyl ester carboxylesterase
MLRVKSILVPTDFSDASAAALHLARSLARDYDAKLVVLHVYPPPFTLAEGVEYSRSDGYLDDIQLTLANWMGDEDTPAVRSRIVEGDPAQEIVRVAAEEGCDLIDLGTHGRTGLRRVLMGSVAEGVSRTARCPVLTIRPGVRVAESLPKIESEIPESAPEMGAGDPVREAMISVHGTILRGELRWTGRPSGVVVFAHGSGSGRYSPRNRFVADALNRAGFATLLLDLLDETEERNRDKVFDVILLADRLSHAVDWVRGQPEMAGLPIGYFGASTGSAAALIAAAKHPDRVAAVVSRGGRPDLAREHLAEVRAPTLLIVGGADGVVLDLNTEADRRLTAEHQLVVVPGATHLFPEPGALDEVAQRAVAWFTRYLVSAPGTT